MTQQYTEENNVTISTPDDCSVPIVSQTEIEPIKTASFPHVRARHDDDGHRGRRGWAARARTTTSHRARSARHAYGGMRVGDITPRPTWSTASASRTRCRTSVFSAPR